MSAEAPTSAEKSINQPSDPAPAAGNDKLRRVTELQVTAHMMTLDPGVFCIFQTPGSPAPDPATGLPGVRVTPSPGTAGRADAVSVSTFRPDGWLDGSAALVRVADGSGQILVTIYQEKGRDAAPRLQVLRLNGEQEMSAAVAAAPGAAASRPSAEPAAEQGPKPEVMAHIQRTGDVGCMLGEWLGQKGSRAWIEGFGIAPTADIALEDIEYQAVLGRNWLSPWVEGGKFCGSRGMALPLLGIKVRLKGAAAKAYDLSYSATFVDGSSAGPVNAGESCEAESLAAMEAFQIVVSPRGEKARPKPASKTPARVSSKP